MFAIYKTYKKNGPWLCAPNCEFLSTNKDNSPRHTGCQYRGIAVGTKETPIIVFKVIDKGSYPWEGNYHIIHFYNGIYTWIVKMNEYRYAQYLLEQELIAKYNITRADIERWSTTIIDTVLFDEMFEEEEKL